MSECWATDPEERPAFGVLSGKLGKLLEAENSNKYVDLDNASLYPFRGVGTTESGSEASGSDGEPSEVDSVSGPTPTVGGRRYVGCGSIITRETTV